MLAPLTLEELRPRFGEAAGLSATEAIADTSAALASLPPVDSVSQWALWSGTNQTAARTELAIGTALGSLRGGGSKFQFTSVEGLIRHEMKLLVSPVGAPISYARPSPRYLSITIAVLITIRPCRECMLVNACECMLARKDSHELWSHHAARENICSHNQDRDVYRLSGQAQHTQTSRPSPLPVACWATNVTK